MKILEASSGWLSNYEVYDHLREQKEQRDRVSANLGQQVKSAENVLTVEFEVRSAFGQAALLTRRLEARLTRRLDALLPGP